jgi:hypothetical protein
MSIREQKFLFTFPIIFMFVGYLASIATCPPWQDGDGWKVFAVEVVACLAPAFVFLGVARRLSRI